jgi:hypothetical protein
MNFLCYKEQAVGKETQVIISTTLCPYLRVTGLNINHGSSWFPLVPPAKMTA